MLATCYGDSQVMLSTFDDELEGDARRDFEAWADKNDKLQRDNEAWLEQEREWEAWGEESVMSEGSAGGGREGEARSKKGFKWDMRGAKTFRCRHRPLPSILVTARVAGLTSRIVRQPARTPEPTRARSCAHVCFRTASDLRSSRGPRAECPTTTCAPSERGRAARLRRARPRG